MGIFDFFKKDKEKPDFSNVEGGSSSTAPEPESSEIPDEGPQAAPLPDEPTEPERKRHTVIKGDTLWEIAQRYYGDGKRWREIYQANEHLIDDPERIMPGQEFVIPMENEEVTS